MGPLGLVAGSGVDLRLLLDKITLEQPFHDLPELALGATPGHGYAFLHGECAGRPVIIQCGRLHAYEGLEWRQVVQTVDALRRFGATSILFTNAAGGLLPEMQPGDLVAADAVHTWPFGKFNLPETLRPDLLIRGCDFTGCYLWMHGPCYETPAEIALARALGAAAVGMSTAPELLRCQQLGIRAGLVSCITNSCLRSEKLTHDHVLDVARRTSAKLCALLRKTIGAWGGNAIAQ